MKRRTDSWEGAIVRHRDRRKGRVLQDGIHHLSRQHMLLVHWDDDSVESTLANRVTMLRPPLHYQAVVPPAREGRFEDRFGPLWAFVTCGTLAAVSIALLAVYLITGAR